MVQLLSEARQQTARVAVRRPGNARLLEFVLTPELMDSPSVDRAFLLEPGIEFVMGVEFRSANLEAIKAGIENGGTALKGLVLDLRVLGGVVPAALETASLFLKPGEKILSVKGRSVQGEDVDVPKTAEPYSFPWLYSSTSGRRARRRS